MRRFLLKGTKALLKGQRGFTLVELLVALGITSAVGTVLVTSLHQMGNFTSRGNAQVSVSADHRTAFRWLARDIAMATSTNLVDENPTVYNGLVLNWSDQYQDAHTPHSASYSLDGTELKRTYDSDTHTVGRNVTSVEFSREGRRVTVTLTSTDDGWANVIAQFTHYFYLYSSP